MILKVLTVDHKGWCLYDHLANLVIREESVKAGNAGQAANLLLTNADSKYVHLTDDDLHSDGYFPLREVCAEQGSQCIQVVFNTQAYLMTDDGKTIETLHAV